MAKEDLLYCENPTCSKAFMGIFSDSGNLCPNCSPEIPKKRRGRPRKK